MARVRDWLAELGPWRGALLVVLILFGVGKAFDWLDKPEFESKRSLIGRPVENEGTRYTVLRVYEDDGIGREEVSGTFLVVEMTLENLKDHTTRILSNRWSLRGGNGSDYDPASEYEINLKNKVVFSEELQPGVPVKVATAFNVPKQAIPGAALEVDDKRVPLGIPAVTATKAAARPLTLSAWRSRADRLCARTLRFVEPTSTDPAAATAEMTGRASRQISALRSGLLRVVIARPHDGKARELLAAYQSVASRLGSVERDALRGDPYAVRDGMSEYTTQAKIADSIARSLGLRCRVSG